MHGHLSELRKFIHDTVNICVDIRIILHSRTHARTHTHTHTYIYIYTHTYTHTHTHTHIYIYIYIYIYILFSHRVNRCFENVCAYAVETLGA